jgi:aryl-alcohol dehydrogenase
MKINAAVVNGPGESIVIEELDLDEPKADEVLVKIMATGICHTDLGVQQMSAIYPIVLGHEGAGIVERVGKAVKGFEPGDRVVISFSSCGECKSCLEGHPGSCKEFGLLNGSGVAHDKTYRLHKNSQNVGTLFGQSSLATYVVTHVNNLVKVDDEVDLRLLGPLACGIQTGAGTVLSKLKPSFGDSIVVFGCGGVGLSALLGAKIANCSSIIAVDINDDRLALAKELGATHTLNGKEVDVIKEIQIITEGGADFSVETTGASPVVLQAVRCLAARGTAALIGLSGDATFNISNDIVNNSRTVVGIIEGDVLPKVFIPTAINYYKQGRFPFDKLIKFYTFEEINKAVEDMQNGTTIKPVIVFS